MELWKFLFLNKKINMSYSVITSKIKKSKNFLFPLLSITKIKRDASFEPVNTYLWWEGTCGIDCLELAVLYDCSNPLFENFEQNYIVQKNPLGMHEMQGFKMYVFDMSSYFQEVDCFLQGRYSLYPDKSKAKIRYYHGDSEINKSAMPMLGHDFKIAFYPEYYFESASKELGVPLQYIKGVGELLSIYDKKDETFVEVEKISNQLILL